MERFTRECQNMGCENQCHCKEKWTKAPYIWRLHVPLLMDRPNGPRVGEDIVELNSTIDQWPLMDFYRIFCTMGAA